MKCKAIRLSELDGCWGADHHLEGRCSYHHKDKLEKEKVLSQIEKLKVKLVELEKREKNG